MFFADGSGQRSGFHAVISEIPLDGGETSIATIFSVAFKLLIYFVVKILSITTCCI